MAVLTGQGGSVTRTVSSPDTDATVQDMAAITMWRLRERSTMVDITPKGVSVRRWAPGTVRRDVDLEGTYSSGNEEEWLNKVEVFLELRFREDVAFSGNGWIEDWKAVADVDGPVRWSGTFTGNLSPVA